MELRNGGRNDAGSDELTLFISYPIVEFLENLKIFLFRFLPFEEKLFGVSTHMFLIYVYGLEMTPKNMILFM